MRKADSGWRRLMPPMAGLLTTLAVGITVFWIDSAENAAYRAAQDQQLLQQVGTLRSSIELTVNLHLATIDALEGVVREDGNVRQEAFQDIAALLMERYSAIRQVQLSPDAIIRHVYPVRPRENIIGLDLRTLPGERALIDRIIAEGEIHTIGPVPLTQGGAGIISRKPVFLSGGGAGGGNGAAEGKNGKRFWGFVTIIIDYRTLLALLRDEMEAFNFESAIRNERTGTVFVGGNALFSDPDAETVAIDAPGANWILAVGPRGGWPETRPRSWVLRVMGVALALAVGILAWLSASRSVALRQRATMDFMTGALNRIAFEDAASQELERAQRYGFPVGLVILDLDRFKAINDTYGHGGGDAVLEAVGNLIHQRLRSSDLFGRLGGEEFGFLLPHTTTAEALTVAESLREGIEALTITYRNERIPVTASMGATATSGADGMGAWDLTALLRQADAALYKAKESGRNRVCMSPAMAADYRRATA